MICCKFSFLLHIHTPFVKVLQSEEQNRFYIFQFFLWYFNAIVYLSVYFGSYRDFLENEFLQTLRTFWRNFFPPETMLVQNLVHLKGLAACIREFLEQFAHSSLPTAHTMN